MQMLSKQATLTARVAPVRRTNRLASHKNTHRRRHKIYLFSLPKIPQIIISFTHSHELCRNQNRDAIKINRVGKSDKSAIIPLPGEQANKSRAEDEWRLPLN